MTEEIPREDAVALLRLSAPLSGEIARALLEAYEVGRKRGRNE